MITSQHRGVIYVRIASGNTGEVGKHIILFLSVPHVSEGEHKF